MNETMFKLSAKFEKLDKIWFDNFGLLRLHGPRVNPELAYKVTNTKKVNHCLIIFSKMEKSTVRIWITNMQLLGNWIEAVSNEDKEKIMMGDANLF